MSDIDDCRKSVERLTRDRGEVMREGNDKIAEIRARHSRDERWRNSPSMICPQAHDDRALLLAEDERHRAEIERLRKAMTNMMIGWRHIRREREEYRAEVERLRAENERLRAALTDMLAGWRYIRETYGDLAGIGWDRAESKAQEALEGKP